MPYESTPFDSMDRARKQAGLLGLSEMNALADRGNVIFDPFSTLISRDALIGSRNVFHPNTRLLCQGGARLRVGSGNIFHNNTVVEASMNHIEIGDQNQFGEGIVCLKVNAPDASIEIGHLGRYCGVINLYGRTRLGTGSQILGNITAYNCILEEGEPYNHPGPDERGAVLKGSGTARNLRLRKGEVIDGWGRFSDQMTTQQSSFHPAPPKDGE
ncbi:MAG: hypothetical protein Tsb0032_10850 [Kiloniellaceae bacterium]